MPHTQANRAQRLDDASFRTLAEVSPAGIWRTTIDGHCMYVNSAWKQATGMTGDDWVGEGWADALHPDDAERVLASFQRAIAEREVFRDEWRWLRPDGTTPWVLCIGGPEFAADGTIAAYVGINIDITEMRQLTRELERARAAAEQAANAKSRFLANMSHEIRTPMNGVLGFVDLLLASDLDPDQRRFTTMIAESGRAMLALLNDILDISKIEAGQLVIENVRLNLYRKLNHCLALVEPTAVAKGLSLDLTIDPDVPQFVMGDPLRLRQILLNLLGNAVKFTAEGSVQMSARMAQTRHGPRIAIAVADTGPGIAPGKHRQIFEPFSQEDGSIARVHGGSGLGLSISRQLAQRMGGSLSLDSRPGEGSTFTVDLPLQVAPSRAADRPRPAPARSVDFTGKRVLIAEDHDINQQLILALAGSLGLTAELAADGLEATMMALHARQQGNGYDAVLMDVQMPRLDGLEAARRLRLSGVTAAELPIVALSANCYPDDIAACLGAGMQAHVGKPVERVALIAALEQVWSPRPAVAAVPAPRAVPSADALAERYTRLRDGLLEQIAASVARADTTDWPAIAADLHKIAGTAAHFGQAEFGLVSRRLERLLTEAERDDERAAALTACLPELRAAA